MLRRALHLVYPSPSLTALVEGRATASVRGTRRRRRRRVSAAALPVAPVRGVGTARLHWQATKVWCQRCSWWATRAVSRAAPRAPAARAAPGRLGGSLATVPRQGPFFSPNRGWGYGRPLAESRLLAPGGFSRYARTVIWSATPRGSHSGNPHPPHSDRVVPCHSTPLALACYWKLVRRPA